MPDTNGPGEVARRPTRRALVVANPIAGRGRAEPAARRLAAGLVARGVETELFLTRQRHDARARVQALTDGTDVVVSVGGDGTLGEVLDGLGTRDVRVAQLPLGTANVLAKDARLPRGVDGAVELILRGTTSLLDTAVVNGRLSFLCVGVGFDGECVAEVERRRRGPITKFDYVRAGLAVVARHRPPRLRLAIDGRAIDGDFGFVLVSNVREYGAAFQLSERCRRDDGLAEVYALRDASRLGLLRFGLVAALTHLPGRVAEFWQARHVRVEAEPDTAWQVDGDLGGHGSIEYAMDGPRHRLVSP